MIAADVCLVLAGVFLALAALAFLEAAGVTAWTRPPPPAPPLAGQAWELEGRGTVLVRDCTPYTVTWQSRGVSGAFEPPDAAHVYIEALPRFLAWARISRGTQIRERIEPAGRPGDDRAPDPPTPPAPAATDNTRVPECLLDNREPA